MMSAARLGAATGTASRFGCGAMSVRGGGTCRGAAAGKEGGRWGHGGGGALAAGRHLVYLSADDE